MKLYSYWRSTTSYRVRIALNLKGVAFTTVPVDLVAGAHTHKDYAAINPSQSVPTLETDDGVRLTQSMAILEWLEETYPNPAMLPSDPMARARVRAAANCVACDIHPVNNLRVVKKLQGLGHTSDQTRQWMCDWMVTGFTALQSLLDDEGPYCFGDTVTLADICLIPQLYNARRWGVDPAPFTRLYDIETQCLSLPAFENARPERQPDASQNT